MARPREGMREKHSSAEGWEPVHRLHLSPRGSSPCKPPSSTAFCLRVSSPSTAAMSLPWLSQPVQLHSSRHSMACELTPEQCAYKKRYWVFWYEADHRYALPTVAFFLACIILFSVLHVLSIAAPGRWSTSGPWRRAASIGRWASYRRWRIGGWNSQSLAAYLLGGVGVIFFAGKLSHLTPGILES